MEMKRSAPAKVNLALDILGRREDGYHEMRMVMQTVSLCDTVTVEETAEELGRQSGAMAFLLPAMGKEQLFKTVMADGVLPRKTFSMGHARDKRYYVEARKIR